MASILIIDDEDQIRKLLSIIFEREGHEVFMASDGDAGIRVFQEKMPDLVVTDIVMPQKEGIETISEMIQIDPSAKIIAISGGGNYHPEEYLNFARKFGARNCISKPIDREKLIEAVNELLADPSVSQN